MRTRPRGIVYDVAILSIVGLFCAILGAHQGQTAGFTAALLVVLAYYAGRSAD